MRREASAHEPGDRFEGQAGGKQRARDQQRRAETNSGNQRKGLRGS